MTRVLMPSTRERRHTGVYTRPGANVTPSLDTHSTTRHDAGESATPIAFSHPPRRPAPQWSGVSVS